MVNKKHRDIKKFKMGVRKRILLIFIIFTLISLISISGIILGFFKIINITTTEDSNEALIAQIQGNLVKSANENSLYISQKFQSAINDVKTAAIYAEYLFNHPNEFNNGRSYNDTDSEAPGLNSSFETIQYYQMVSFDYSCFHLAPSLYVNSSYSTADSSIWREVNKSSNLDNIFKILKQNNPDFGWIYMGFLSGIHRSYPWHAISTNYDPRLRGWFNNSLSNPYGLVISDPYIDASGLGLMVTISHSIHYSNGTIIGVLAADLTIDVIIDKILDIKILNTGYAFLLDDNINAIAHPDMTENIFNSNGGNVDIALFIQIDDIQKDYIKYNQNGLISFQISEETNYIAFSKVNYTRFIVGNVVSEAEVLTSAIYLKNEIDTLSNTVFFTIFFVMIAATSTSIFFGLIIAGKITIPVKKLTTAVKKLTKQDIAKTLLISGTDFQIDSELEAQNDEIGDLTRAFKGMLHKIEKKMICHVCGGILPIEFKQKILDGEDVMCENCGTPMNLEMIKKRDNQNWIK